MRLLRLSSFEIRIARVWARARNWDQDQGWDQD